MLLDTGAELVDASSDLFTVVLRYNVACAFARENGSAGDADGRTWLRGFDRLDGLQILLSICQHMVSWNERDIDLPGVCRAGGE